MILRRNNVKVTGRGSQPMLFAHGFGCDQNMWRFVAPAFEDDYKVVLFDYVGSGKSDLSAYDPQRYGTLRGYAQDVVDVCAALDLRDVIFVGHSVSSMIGVLAAQMAPDRFSRLIMIGPSPRYINAPGYAGGFEQADIEGLLDMMDRNFMGWASTMAPVIMKNPEHPEYTRELEESFCSTDPRMARRFAEATFFGDNREDLAGVRIPSLIMQCSDDVIAPLAVGDYLSQRIAGSTLRVMKATGHCPHLSHPEETIQVMKEYLSADV
jgi:sigma-B regulation protein RsbQ